MIKKKKKNLKFFNNRLFKLIQLLIKIHSARIITIRITVFSIDPYTSYNIDIFSSPAVEESVEGRNIITMVTKYPLGTMEGGLAAWKGVEEERTNGRTKGIARAGWKERWRWLPAVLIIVPPLSFWCSGLPGAERLNVSLQSKYRLPWLCSLMSSKGRRIYRVYRRHPARDTESGLALSRKPGFHVECWIRCE